MQDRPPFNASTCTRIVKGTCVVLDDGMIFYAGPINSAPDVAGKDVMMNPEDFEKLKVHVDKRRH